MVKAFGQMDGGTVDALKRDQIQSNVHKRRQMQSTKSTRQFNSQTIPNLARATKASPLKGQNEKNVVDAATISSRRVKRNKTGPNQLSYRESNVPAKHVLSKDIRGTTELKKLPTPTGLFEDECIFCHSFRTGEFHGPMVRYLKGRVVSIDEGNSSNAIYVHKNCLEWAPRVFFEGDIVVNLESEIRRASRLRCRRCGLLGAALGCNYDLCRKSFHVSCAAQIIGCHWDNEGHLLCPEHVSKALPCELSTHTKENDNSSSLRQSPYIDKEVNFDNHPRKNQERNQFDVSIPSYLPQSQCSKKVGIPTNSSRDGLQIDQLDTTSSSSLPLGQHSDDEGISKNRERDGQRAHKHSTSNLSSLPQSCRPDEEEISNAYQRKETKAYQPDTSSCPSDQLVLLGLSLNAPEKDSLQEFACWTNATLTKEWAKNVTHVIVGKGAGSSWRLSFEVLMAILLGKWVVHFEWIADCSSEMTPRPEASYEVAFSVDSLRTIDGPKKGRLRATKGAPNLFSGLRFCLSAYMSPDNRNRMRDLIAAAKGRVLEEGDLKQLLLEKTDGSSVKPYFFVYDVDAPGEFALSTLREEVEEAKRHQAAGAQLICHSRVLDAVAACDAEILDAKKDS